jgi:hypothetical protein
MLHLGSQYFRQVCLPDSAAAVLSAVELPQYLQFECYNERTGREGALLAADADVAGCILASPKQGHSVVELVLAGRPAAVAQMSRCVRHVTYCAQHRLRVLTYNCTKG